MKLVARIQETVREINTAAQEISAGNTNLSERTCQQSAILEETSSSMEEMAIAVKAAANNAQAAQQLAFAARKQATRGGAILDTAIASMSKINSARVPRQRRRAVKYLHPLGSGARRVGTCADFLERWSRCRLLWGGQYGPRRRPRHQAP